MTLSGGGGARKPRRRDPGNAGPTGAVSETLPQARVRRRHPGLTPSSGAGPRRAVVTSQQQAAARAAFPAASRRSGVSTP
jgi:hypothetical protein